eukprot:TRINITY_DN1640_c0_g1_i1.p1 TRINITY_DN1640_c0_g1~~TRINITY_DN1640_c0_g1_i1.p1  ORF type:complete len:209 (+),score=47.94 TRINITY_DN1640_c0_g1_i1:77-703(+)
MSFTQEAVKEARSIAGQAITPNSNVLGRALTGLPITSEYGFVILAAAGIALQVPLAALPLAGLRAKLFDKAFFHRHFNFTEDEIPEHGYPDMGNGRYSEKLTLAEWQQFNNYQRAHQNYVEIAASAISLTLLAGLFYPRLAAISGFSMMLGRFLYSVGYRATGPKGRNVGKNIFHGGLLALLGATVYGAFNFAGGFAGVKNFFRLSLN